MSATHVSCLLCGLQAQTLARHLKAAHNITADEYRAKFPKARIRSEVCEANRRAAITKAHEEKPREGLKKNIACSSCGAGHEVGLTFASKDRRCPECKATEEWADKVEGEDFVTCQGCGHRAENLTSHVQSAHPDWIGCYPGQITALQSAVRDKTALKGRPLSDETRGKMSANAGRWNAGLTKETDPSLATMAEKRMGQPSWSKGLTKADHPSLRATAEKLSLVKRGVPNDAARLDLSEVDFTPYLDETGAVDRRTMAEELGICEPTLTKYMGGLGLRISSRYVDARAERQTIRLEKAELEKHTLGNGKVVIAQAMVALGRAFKVIKRECERHGLETFSHRVRQTICLEAVSKALGGALYEQEWKAWRFVNPKSGHRFRFDGYFPTLDLVCEFHGYQHWTFPSVYIKRDELYFALQERDRLKENLVHADPTLRYFLVREDEPYGDPAYLQGRLLDEGVLDPPR